MSLSNYTASSAARVLVTEKISYAKIAIQLLSFSALPYILTFMLVRAATSLRFRGTLCYMLLAACKRDVARRSMKDCWSQREQELPENGICRRVQRCYLFVSRFLSHLFPLFLSLISICSRIFCCLFLFTVFLIPWSLRSTRVVTSRCSA